MWCNWNRHSYLQYNSTQQTILQENYTIEHNQLNKSSWHFICSFKALSLSWAGHLCVILCSKPVKWLHNNIHCRDWKATYIPHIYSYRTSYKTTWRLPASVRDETQVAQWSTSAGARPNTHKTGIPRVGLIQLGPIWINTSALKQEIELTLSNYCGLLLQWLLMTASVGIGRQWCSF